jgi:hypothetical protein
MSEEGKGRHAASSAGGGGLGCLGSIAVFFVLWALIFGITVDGRHYEVDCTGCTCDQGVVVHADRDGVP